ncbi:uncharacterized protein LOC144748324 [Ciona intestinalis]
MRMISMENAQLGDMWFSNDLARYSLFSRNWENTKPILEKADKATSADYKNIGYSSIKAANLMLRPRIKQNTSGPIKSFEACNITQVTTSLANMGEIYSQPTQDITQ